ncbi:MAG: transcription antitermination factor NusB, partial [Pseudomonadota bacterium]
MKVETPRDMALKVLDGLTHKTAFSSNALDDLFQSNPHLNDRDRAFINQLVQGVLRWRMRLDWIIGQAADFPLERITPGVMSILRLALFQVFFLDRVPESAAVNEAVKQAKKCHGRHVVSFVNGILRNICRQKDHMPFPDRDGDPVKYLCLFYSYPEWLVKKWLRELGPDVTEGMLSAGNRIPTLAIRTNVLRLDRSQLLSRLGEEAIKGKPTPYSPAGVLLEG